MFVRHDIMQYVHLHRSCYVVNVQRVTGGEIVKMNKPQHHINDNGLQQWGGPKAKNGELWKQKAVPLTSAALWLSHHVTKCPKFVLRRAQRAQGEQRSGGGCAGADRWREVRPPTQSLPAPPFSTTTLYDSQRLALAELQTEYDQKDNIFKARILMLRQI